MYNTVLAGLVVMYTQYGMAELYKSPVILNAAKDHIRFASFGNYCKLF